MASGAEYENIEYKQSLAEWKEVVASVSAFANARGGRIQIGITKSGQEVGVQLGNNSLEQLANSIKTNTQPPQYPSIQIKGPEISAIVTVIVEESPVKPVFAFNIAYKRVGRTNQKLSPDEIRRLMESTSGRTWETLTCPGLQFEDLDRTAVEYFLRASGQDVHTSTKNVLENLGLMTSDGLCFAAALLFAKNPQRFVAEAQVKCARFLGTSSVRFLDEQTIYGNLLTQADTAIAFVSRNTRQSINITGRAQSEVIPEYPEEAIREAVINAICHRDYTSPGTVQIRIYDDRLEIWNPGTLPPELTIEALYSEHPSHPRYPRLADALHRAHIIEHWGTGTLRIVAACRKREMPGPQFRSAMGVFIVEFNAEKQLPSASNINERQKEAIAFVQEHGRIASGQYSQLFGIGERQTRNDLQTLIAQKIFIRRGGGRSTYYTLRTLADTEEIM